MSILVATCGTVLPAAASGPPSGKCTGKFPNPVGDVCWSCLFPLVQGSFEKTLLAARQVFDDRALSGVAVDPQVFWAYEVDRVPTFIVAREPVTPCQDGVDCTSAATAHDKIAGNVTASAALRLLSQRGRQAPNIVRTALARLEG